MRATPGHGRWTRVAVASGLAEIDTRTQDTRGWATPLYRHLFPAP